ANERHYVIMSQVVTILLMIVSLGVTFRLDSIGAAWKILLVTGAGTGTVLLLRWFWWRINAWSEVSAMIAAAVCSIFLQTYYGMDSDKPKDFAYLMLITVAFTTVVWVTVTFLTPAEPMEKLINFYRKVRPDGAGWRPVVKAGGLQRTDVGGGLALQFVNWFVGCVLIYAFLFGLGYVIFGAWLKGLALLVLGVFAWLVISRNLQRADWQAIKVEPQPSERAIAGD